MDDIYSAMIGAAGVAISIAVPVAAAVARKTKLQEDKMDSLEASVSKLHTDVAVLSQMFKTRMDSDDQQFEAGRNTMKELNKSVNELNISVSKLTCSVDTLREQAHDRK